MDWLRFVRRGRWDTERQAEIDAHLQMQVDELIAGGMADGEAHSEAGDGLATRGSCARRFTR